MIRFILTSVFSLFFLQVFAQTVNIVKTDNSQFPQIKVYLSVHADTVSKNDFKISEQGKPVNFKFDTLPSSDISTTKAVLFLSEQDCLLKDKLSLALLAESFTLLKKFDKINTCYFSGQDTAGLSLGITSAEFSTNKLFFSANYDKLSPVRVNRNIEIQDDFFFSRLTSALNYTKTRENLPETKAIILLTGEISKADENNEAFIIKEAKKNKISIYIIDIGVHKNLISQSFIKICTQTGGIYTRIKTKEIPQTISKYLEDIEAGIKLPPSHSYTFTFLSEQSKRINYFEIDYKGQKIKSFYIKNGFLDRFSVREYILATISFFLVLLFATIYFFKIRNLQKQKNIVPNTSPEITKDFSHEVTTEPILIVNTKGKIKTFRITKPEINIGRRIDNSIAILDATVSAYHALIFYYSGKFYIKDLDSTNGVYVNGNKEKICVLNNNDKIKVGVSLITLRISSK